MLARLGSLRWRPGAAAALLRSAVLVAAALAIMLVYWLLNLPAMSWALISLMLVSQTQAAPAFRLATIRVAANIIGAIIALAVLHAAGGGWAAIAAALLLVGVVCHQAWLDDGLRSASVCVVIVMAADQMVSFAPPLERIASVTAGSLIGAGVSWVVEKIERRG